jgi:hypothetical protein
VLQLAIRSVFILFPSRGLYNSRSGLTGMSWNHRKRAVGEDLFQASPYEDLAHRHEGESCHKMKGASKGTDALG